MLYICIKNENPKLIYLEALEPAIMRENEHAHAGDGYTSNTYIMRLYLLGDETLRRVNYSSLVQVKWSRRSG